MGKNQSINHSNIRKKVNQLKAQNKIICLSPGDSIQLTTDDFINKDCINISCLIKGGLVIEGGSSLVWEISGRGWSKKIKKNKEKKCWWFFNHEWGPWEKFAVVSQIRVCQKCGLRKIK
jgi:hypothetical protein